MRVACCIIFYNIFSENVNNLYETISRIISFLFFFVGKVLVVNEKNLRNNLYLTDNVNNLYKSILLISCFLFFFVGKVLVANEKSLRNNLYLTDDVNIFGESVPDTTEKNLE